MEIYRSGCNCGTEFSDKSVVTGRSTLYRLGSVDDPRFNLLSTQCFLAAWQPSACPPSALSNSSKSATSLVCPTRVSREPTSSSLRPKRRLTLRVRRRGFFVWIDHRLRAISCQHSLQPSRPPLPLPLPLPLSLFPHPHHPYSHFLWKDSANLWKKMFIFIGVPVILVGGANAYKIESDHHKHLLEHPEHFKNLPYLHVRNKVPLLLWDSHRITSIALSMERRLQECKWNHHVGLVVSLWLLSSSSTGRCKLFHLRTNSLYRLHGC